MLPKKHDRGPAGESKDHRPMRLLLFDSRYNWSPAIITQEVKVAQATSGTEYIPMIWGEKDTEASRLANLKALGKSSNLLGFNEPNFGAQVTTTSKHKTIIGAKERTDKSCCCCGRLSFSF